MTYPFPFPITTDILHKPLTGTTEDGLGNTVPSFGDSVPLGRYTIAPHIVEQGSATATQTVVADLDVLMPKADVKTEDLFVIDGVEYEIVGIDDWTMGIPGFEPGIMVAIQKVS